MELFLDTADSNAVTELSDTLTIAGVTTNPTILAQSGTDPVHALRRLDAAMTPEQKLCVQVIADADLNLMMQDVRAICGLRQNAYAKIPVTPAGLQAIKVAKQEGLSVVATAIYSADTAFLAAMNGADYLSPYVNRMCNLSDGMAQMEDLVGMLAFHGLSAQILAASFKNTLQVHELIRMGVHAMTVPPDIVRRMVRHPSTQPAVDEFNRAWESSCNRKTFA